MSATTLFLQILALPVTLIVALGKGWAWACDRMDYDTVDLAIFCLVVVTVCAVVAKLLWILLGWWFPLGVVALTASTLAYRRVRGAEP